MILGEKIYAGGVYSEVLGAVELRPSVIRCLFLYNPTTTYPNDSLPELLTIVTMITLTENTYQTH